MSIAITVGDSVMASPSPRCEIRQLVVHVYPGGIKAHDAKRLTVFYGRWEQPLRPASAGSGRQDSHLLQQPPLATGVHEVVGRHGAAHGHRRHADAGEYSGAADH